MTLRFILQTTILYLLASIYPNLGIASIIIILGFANYASYFRYLPISYFKSILTSFTVPISTLLRFKTLWFAALLSTFLLYSDRILSSLFNPNILAGYFLLVSSFSLVQAAVNFYYLSYLKPSIVSGSISFSSLIYSRKL